MADPILSLLDVYFPGRLRFGLTLVLQNVFSFKFTSILLFAEYYNTTIG